VYIRDIGQSMTVLVQLLIFLSPIFYPVSAVPDWLQSYLYLNPLTPIVGMFRGALVWDELWSWQAWLGLVGWTGAIACLGYGWFMVNRRGFADVL
jgi:lipopolysaccharide transport system permease protein